MLVGWFRFVQTTLETIDAPRRLSGRVVALVGLGLGLVPKPSPRKAAIRPPAVVQQLTRRVRADAEGIALVAAEDKDLAVLCASGVEADVALVQRRILHPRPGGENDPPDYEHEAHEEEDAEVALQRFAGWAKAVSR